MGKRIKSCISMAITLLIISDRAQASSVSLGEAIGNILPPLNTLGSLIHVVCIVAGAGFLVGSAMRYKRHRQNPVESPLSSCIMLFLTGLALLALSLIPMPK